MRITTAILLVRGRAEIQTQVSDPAAKLQVPEPERLLHDACEPLPPSAKLRLTAAPTPRVKQAGTHLE